MHTLIVVLIMVVYALVVVRANIGLLRSAGKAHQRLDEYEARAKAVNTDEELRAILTELCVCVANGRVAAARARVVVAYIRGKLDVIQALAEQQAKKQ